MIEESIMVKPDVPLGQGDIIELFNGSVDNKYGVIVTSDCDIAYGKSGQFLSFCYIMKLENYFNNYYLSSEVKKYSCTLFSEILKSVNGCLKKKYPEHKGLTEIGLRYMLENSDISDLKKLDYSIPDTLIKKIEVYKMLLNNESVSIFAFKELLECIGQDINNSFINKQKSTFSNKIISPPGDQFYISYLPNVNSLGFIINLRRINEIEIKNIALIPSMEPNCTAKRIGRFISPYKEKMVQKLGSMFSDIGLCEEYEKERFAIVEDIFNTKWGL